MTRVAIIGLGMAVKPHVAALHALRHRAEVAACYSPSPERRAAFAGTHGLPIADDLDAILADPSIEAVLVLTPPSTHLDLVRRAAAAGKHVLLEKPLEIDAGRARSLVEAAEGAGVRLGIVLQNRFRPSLEGARGLLREGTLGELVSVSARLSNYRPQSYYDEPGRGTRARDGGGVLLTQGIHTLDAMIALTGLPEEVAGFAATSRAHRMETEDVAHAALRFANGALGAVSATTAAFPGFPDAIDLFGTLGSLRLDSTGADVALLNGRQWRIDDGSAGNGAGADPMAFSSANHERLIADFLDSVSEGREPRVSGREALKVHALIDAILASSEASGAPRRVGG
ncbi:Gfo/Idh/MocA family oxidoreductase [Aureimonas sp. SK2]|uniref:Gfo/Idh/MocA family protein n=1 Tax=Aureimonas sp. SK2 TaxID=3015992 RepID=UPI002443AD29|nr:Gfo/Idh/MocA family oxidoreductase [Aureimonas sp. SK2]